MHCRLCKSQCLTDVINLGSQVITSRFPIYGDKSTPSTPICIAMCDECKLVQLKESVAGSELYEYEYGYRSGLSNTMREHLKVYNKQVTRIASLKDGDSVLDIGCNDGTFLKNYPDTVKRTGIDPTGKQFAENYTNGLELIPTYFSKEAIIERYGEDKKFKIVTSISMFYDLPDPVQFARDIEYVLEADGIWSLEQSYILTMINRNSIDTICHEHIEYYGLHQIKNIMDRANLKIIHVEENDCNGGSFRIYVAKRDSKHNEAVDTVKEFLQREDEAGLANVDTYYKFMERCNIEVAKLNSLIDTINSSGKKIYIYGASTKGNCLLQYAKLGEDKIRYAVERNLNKVGKMTSTGIEIISEESMRKNPPEYLLVLPWHFKEEIIAREDEYLSRGGQLVFPFPNVSVKSKYQKVLITGIDGQIGHYVHRELKDSCSVYGISRSYKSKSDATTFCFSITENNMLESTITTICPDVIIHLAGISNTEECINKPLVAALTNGYSTVNICGIIHKNRLVTKLLNASSSELYKGHVNYEVKEDDDYFKPNHPYAFAKLLGHNTIDYYRNTFNLPFYNCILFTTESRLRTSQFLFRKVAKHIENWKRGDKTPLSVGSLNSYRVILHAADVASAFKTMIFNELNGNYIICSDNKVKVLDVVKQMYDISGVKLTIEEGRAVDQNGEHVMNIASALRGVETDITGKCEKLHKLGWSQKYTLEDICLDHLGHKII